MPKRFVPDLTYSMPLLVVGSLFCLCILTNSFCFAMIGGCAQADHQERELSREPGAALVRHTHLPRDFTPRQVHSNQWGSPAAAAHLAQLDGLLVLFAPVFVAALVRLDQQLFSCHPPASQATTAATTTSTTTTSTTTTSTTTTSTAATTAATEALSARQNAAGEDRRLPALSV